MSTSMARRLTALVLLAAACSSGEDLTDPGPGPEAHTMILTEPVTNEGAIQSLSKVRLERNATAPEVVYVSLVAGSVPNGVEAKVYNLRTRQTEVRPMIEGGLDPVVIQGSVGDSVEVSTLDRQGGIRLFGSTVQVKRRPEVVRTGPPRGQKDIGLNAVIVVVFSEPLNPSSVTGLSVRVLRQGQPIDATINLAADGIQAELKPAQPLEPATTHEIVVTTSIADLAGDQMEQEFRSDFRTAAGPVPTEPVAAITISPADTSAAAGEVLALSAEARDASGQQVAVLMQWTSSNPSVARVTEAGEVYAVGLGTAEIRATAQGKTAGAEVQFTPASFASVTAGGLHSCALAPNARVLCWGGSDWSQAGSGAPQPRLIPATVGNGLYQQVEAGRRHTCAVQEDNSAACWGSNGAGQLGINVVGGLRAQPSPVVGAVSFGKLTAADERTCGLDRAGFAYCWGAQYAGGDTWVLMNAPLRLLTATSFQTVSSGRWHDCALATSGQVYCWGTYNLLGQLGNGSTTAQSLQDGGLAPEPIASELRFTALAVGSTHSCGITAGGTYCWGSNFHEALGTSTTGGCLVDWPWGQQTDPCSTLPLRANVAALVSITAGEDFTCGLTAEGIGYCWGYNVWGQLGNGGFEESAGPTPVAGNLRFESLSAGTSHVCGRTREGTLYCWGRGTEGQLGTGSTESSAVPVRVALQGT